MGKSKLLGMLLLLCSSFISLEQNKTPSSKKKKIRISYPWSQLWVLFPVPSSRWKQLVPRMIFEGPVCSCHSPTQAHWTAPSPRGAGTEDIANTEGKYKQEVIILPNSHNYSDKKSYSKGMLQGPPIETCLPIHYLSLNFQKKGGGGGGNSGEPSTNSRLKWKLLARDARVSISNPKMYIHIQRKQWNKRQP